MRSRNGRPELCGAFLDSPKDSQIILDILDRDITTRSPCNTSDKYAVQALNYVRAYQGFSLLLDSRINWYREGRRVDDHVLRHHLLSKQKNNPFLSQKRDGNLDHPDRRDNNPKAGAHPATCKLKELSSKFNGVHLAI